MLIRQAEIARRQATSKCDALYAIEMVVNLATSVIVTMATVRLHRVRGSVSWVRAVTDVDGG